MSKANETYVVIGAYGGIGSAVVRELRARNADVVLAGRDGVRLRSVADELGGEPYETDATDPSAVEHAARFAVETYGGLTGIANCAGSLLLKPAHLTSAEDWSNTIATNLGTAFATVRAAGRVMGKGGSVVLVSSAAARIGLSNHEAIAAAKAGVVGLTLSAAATYASRGLRFNAVAPGLVDTPMTARITGNDTAKTSSEAMHAIGRLGDPHDVARAIVWLLDPVQSWVTGQVIGVDGGLGSVRSRRG